MLMFRPPRAGELRRGQVPKRHVGPVVVVFHPPVVDEHLGLEQGVEGLHLEQLASEVPIEGLHVGILPGSPGLDVGGGDALEARDIGRPVWARWRSLTIPPLAGHLE